MVPGAAASTADSEVAGGSVTGFESKRGAVAPPRARLSSLPGTLLCLVFSCLPLEDNRRLARCATAFHRTGKLHTASPLSIELDESSGRRDWGAIMAHMAGTMWPRHLAFRCLDVGTDVDLAQLARITSLRRLKLLHVAPANVDRLSDLAALTDLTVRFDFSNAGRWEEAVAACTALVRLNIRCARATNLQLFAALPLLESLTLEDPQLCGAHVWEPLGHMPRLSELGVICTVEEWRSLAMPPLPATLALRRVVLHGDFGFSGGSTVASLPSLRSLDVERCNSRRMLYVRDMTRLESLALSFSELLPSPDNPNTLAVFGRLVLLHSLTLRNARISNLAGLEQLAALTELDLRQCSELVALTGLGAGVTLRSLSLTNCAKLSDVQALTLATGLESLVMDACVAL